MPTRSRYSITPKCLPILCATWKRVLPSNPGATSKPIKPTCARLLANAFRPDDLHRLLDTYAKVCCPVVDAFAQTYHWSLMQTEYSTDLVFDSRNRIKTDLRAAFQASSHHLSNTTARWNTKTVPKHGNWHH